MTNNDKMDLRWAMQAALLEQASVLHENKNEVKNFVLAEATYEQLLNLCFNPFDSNEVYMESTDLEYIAQDVIYEMTGAYEEEEEYTIAEKYNLLESIVLEYNSTDSYWKKDIPKPNVVQRVGNEVALAGQSAKRGAKAAGEKIKDVATKTGRNIKAAALKAKRKSRGSVEKVKKGAQAAIKKAGEKAGATKDWMKANKGKTAAIGVAGAAGAYYVYRKMRKAGKNKAEAARAAAQVAKTPEQKAKFQKMAAQGS